MIGPVLPCAFVCALGLAAMALSFFVLHRAQDLVRSAGQGPQKRPPDYEAALRDLREGLDSMAAQVHDLQRQPAHAVVPAAPKTGLNVNKRSQALRMNRRGDSAEQIATVLEIPLQEVDLLLKVHRIVITNI
jgi:hypothetical protein